jgi:hypothetical protein
MRKHGAKRRLRNNRPWFNLSLEDDANGESEEERIEGGEILVTQRQMERWVKEVCHFVWLVKPL